MEDERNVNNCTWRRMDRAYSCAYPDREEPVTGDDPLLNGYILFNEGTQANVMSYIRIQAQNAPPTNFGLFQALAASSFKNSCCATVSSTPLLSSSSRMPSSDPPSNRVRPRSTSIKPTLIKLVMTGDTELT